MTTVTDIHAVRREAVLRVIDERFGGSRSAFARAIDRPLPNVSRMLRDEEAGKDSRKIGEDLARHIESSLGLSLGALDSRADEVASPPVPQHQAAYERASAEAQQAVDLLLRLPEARQVEALAFVKYLADQASRTGN